MKDAPKSNKPWNYVQADDGTIHHLQVDFKSFRPLCGPVRPNYISSEIMYTVQTWTSIFCVIEDESSASSNSKLTSLCVFFLRTEHTKNLKYEGVVPGSCTLFDTVTADPCLKVAD